LGQVNAVPVAHSRTLTRILIHNLLTPFNVLLGGLLVAILIIGPLQDALFGLVLIVNTPIGLVQEIRAKRVLDRLAIVTAQRSTVLRDGEEQEIPSGAIVVDDLVLLRLGDQVPVDGDVIESASLEVDESLVTGESAPAVKAPGDRVLSGSFTVAGHGLIQATHVGTSSFGNLMATEARRFTRVRSELRHGIDRFLIGIGVLMVPVGAVLVLSQIAVSENTAEAVRSSVAGLVTMVPEGLVLLTSVVFAVAAVRFAKRGIIAQELASVEMLARADVICLDKTGTLTDGRMAVERVIPLNGSVPHEALAALAAVNEDGNRTVAAIADAFPMGGEAAPQTVVAFSSSRKWSAVELPDQGTWILGAPEVLSTDTMPGSVHETAEQLAMHGARVLLVARAQGTVTAEAPPEALQPVALIELREHVRPDAAEIIEYYREQRIEVKLLSGDNPHTVAAIAGAVGVDVKGEPADGRTLPEDAEDLADVAQSTTVFGRLAPDHKRRLVHALQSRGHVVAMTGDGVNDVLALKAADISVAMGSGTSAARAVGRLTLTGDTFSSVPFAIREGRRVIANLERVATFFLTKTCYAIVLSLAVAIRAMPFPLLPRQLSLIGLLVIGLPAFALSFAPSAERARKRFVQRTLRFVIPAGVVAGAAAYVAFEVGRAGGYSLGGARTAATVVLLAVSVWIVARVSWPLRPWKIALLGVMVLASVVIFLLPLGQALYGVGLLPARAWVLCAAVSGGGIVVLECALRVAALVRHRIWPPATRHP
jgi:cation-transporting ATPase E